MNYLRLGSGNTVWRLYDWLTKYYGFYIAAVVGIISGRGISVHMRRGN